MDFNDDDGEDFSTPLETEEDRLKKEAKKAAFFETQRWIEKITNKRFSYDDDFRRSLSDGILLCNLLNCLKPGSVKRINKISTAISGYDNIGKFLRVCEEDFGLSNVILFETSDLEDLSNKSNDMTVESDRRLQKVLICLFHLAKSVENHMTNEILDSKPFRLLLQSQDLKVMRSLQSKSESSDTSHDKDISKLIQNQNPNYLASIAQETLKKAQLNQYIFHKSVDDEEWQESLENWREKRRNVISNPSLDEPIELSGDSQELLDLKEKARKMRLEREQLKDQSIIAAPQSNNQVINGDSQQLPDIDEETKAMIERVKQKKLEEENKRRFSLSPPLSAAFASDSELSTSTAVDKHEEEPQSISERNDIIEDNHSEVIHTNNIPGHVLVEADIVKDKNPAKGRLVNVKLTRRSKQDCDQLWGMELTKGVTGAIVSKVKIGSCADVCEVRKGDKIVCINSEDVSNKSLEYIQSFFDQNSSEICSQDSLRLTLRRPFNEEEEDDFFNSDQSDTNEDYFEEDACMSKVPDNLHEPEINYFKNSLEEAVEEDYKDAPITQEKAVLTNVINTCEASSKVPESQSAAESIFHYKQESSFPFKNNLVSIYPNVRKTTENDDFEKENDRKLSVQEKIAKIESHNVVNTSSLISSWNIPKKSDNDPNLNKPTVLVSHSTEGLSSNSDKSRQISSGNSSLSNLYNYWETETPKSASYLNTKVITKSTPLMQVPLNSANGDHENIEMEIAEQQFDTSNVNLEETWRTVNSSGNSSTSDDVSALNDTVCKGHYTEGDSVAERLTDDTINSGNGYEKSFGLSLSNIVPSPIHHSEETISSKNKLVIGSSSTMNTSTGVQADLVSRQKPTNYTTVTTSFEGRYKSPQSFPPSRMSDDETCSFTISNNQNDQQDSVYSPSELKDSSYQNLHSIIPNYNNFSKDYTTITAVSKANNQSKVLTCTPLSNESTVTGISRDIEKSVEIEVSVTPQLFPIRNKTLFSKNLKDKNELNKHNEGSLFFDNSFVDENTLLITDLDEVITPVKYVPQCHVDINSRRDDTNPSVSHSLHNVCQPHVEKSKKQNKRMSEENGYVHSSKDVITDNKSQSCHTTVTTDPSMSIISVPTLFKGEHRNENPNKSDNYRSKNVEPTISSKNIKKCFSAGINNLPEFKRSSSTKELRIAELPNDNDEYNKRRSSFLDEPKHNSLNNSKYSEPQYSQPRSYFTLPNSTNVKSHTKSYSIERPVKQVSFNQNPEYKKPQKSSTFKDTKVNMKCNFCSTLVGLEDLMVIEELNLHFHLRCFICSECNEPLGDGKSDTDVRIRRSKLHCVNCYNKKSSKSKHRLGSMTSRTSQPMVNLSQNKGGRGEGQPLHVHADHSNNYASTNNISPFYPPSPGLSSNNNALLFPKSSTLQVSFADTF